MTGESEVRNSARGGAGSHIVQARDITGGVHFHGTAREPVVPRQLPAAPRTFTGRDAEVAELTKAFDAGVEHGTTVVISAIGGAGGIGKTWLALHWAHAYADRFPDGQLFVNLRGFHPSEEPMPPHEALRVFLDALGMEPGEIPRQFEAQMGLYRSLVAGRRMLIVLDNARDTTQVAPLLPGAPACTVLVTSRDRMASLVATHSARPVQVDALGDDEARALLARQLGESRIAAEPGATDQLVRWCAGLPLALGIVASRAVLEPHLPLSGIAEELEDTSQRLEALSLESPEACLETVLSWSYRALRTTEATMFRMVGLAPGADVSVYAAASLAGTTLREARNQLRTLENVSLVQQHTKGRYRMHDLVRLYAARQAEEEDTASERDMALYRLTEYGVHTAHAADLLIAKHHAPIALAQLPPACSPQPLKDVQDAWRWLNAERLTLLAVQHVAVEKKWNTQVWQLAWTLTTFQLRQGRLDDNLSAWRMGAPASDHLDADLRTRSYRHLGRACALAGLHEEAVTHLQTGLAVAAHDNDRLGQAHTHRALAKAWEVQGNDREALAHSRHAWRLFQELDIDVSGTNALNEIGRYTARLGDYAEAREICSRALDRCSGGGNPSGKADILDNLGYIAHYTGEYTHAEEHYQQALNLYYDLGNESAQADTLDHLGHTYAVHDREQARGTWEKALDLYASQHRADDASRVREQLAALSQEPAES
ncbi:ATP-binding protein [Streptomyces sp. NPDC048172]|uniref:ATP-binding protein n=1 Tax=Streptomyces sp. NPDC048172 TaxID=3365505 RepID=UPI003712D684